MTHAALLLVLICGPADLQDSPPPDACEHGEIRWHSCAAAEGWLRAGLRRGQVLHVLGCEPARVAAR